MDTSESPLKVTPGQSFCVTPVTASPVTVSAGDITLCQIEPGTQGIFIAPAGVTEISLSAAANVQAVFKYAPALTQRGGNPTPSPEPVPTGGALKHGHIYALTVTDATDLSALTLADDATAELWLTYSAGAVTWPSSWVWGTDTFDSASPESAPDFVSGEFYCVVVRHYAVRGIVIATLSHTVK